MTQPAPAPPALDTAEQLSGRAADAVADMREELRRRYSSLNSAEARLAEALLTAQATSEAGRRRLQAIQQELVAAINNPVNALDTPAGERQFLIFLRGKIAEIQQIVADGTLTAEEQAELTRVLADGYLLEEYLGDGPVPPRPLSPTPSSQQPSQPVMGTPPAAGMSAMPPAMGGGPQAAAPGMPPGGMGVPPSPLAGLGSLLSPAESVPDDTERGKITTEHDDDDADEHSADPETEDPSAAPDDVPQDDAGPAETRPAAS